MCDDDDDESSESSFFMKQFFSSEKKDKIPQVYSMQHVSAWKFFVYST